MLVIPVLSPVRKPDGTILGNKIRYAHETENKMSIPKNDDMKLPEPKTTDDDSMGPGNAIESVNWIKLYPQGTLYPIQRKGAESENAGQIAGAELDKSPDGRSDPPIKSSQISEELQNAMTDFKRSLGAMDSARDQRQQVLYDIKPIEPVSKPKMTIVLRGIDDEDESYHLDPCHVMVALCLLQSGTNPDSDHYVSELGKDRRKDFAFVRREGISSHDWEIP